MPKNPFPFLRMDVGCCLLRRTASSTVRMVPTVWPLCHTVPLSAAAAVAAATSVELILPVCQCHAPLLVAPLPHSLCPSLCCASLLLQIAVDTFIWLVSLLIPCKACRKGVELWLRVSISLSVCVTVVSDMNFEII